MSSSEAESFVEEPTPSSAVVPLSPNQNLPTGSSNPVSPSVSITTVNGSLASESGDSGAEWLESSGDVTFPPENSFYGLRPVRASTDLRSPVSHTSTSSSSTTQITETSSNANQPCEDVGDQVTDPLASVESMDIGDALANSDSIEMTLRFSELIFDIDTPNVATRRRHRRLHAQALDRAQRMQDGSLSDSETRSRWRVPSRGFAQVLRHGNSVSDCSQCSSDEDEEKNPKVPDYLAEWLYPI
ncbi:uncharacterized protein LOC108105940 [Drosophila eugracilis]|uniref:uncharacterized protein LOC108105940 n=1 Tax=Drosophila eugracilis TaxID=29029 RepID=UPI0007E63522|nr:uncharacterized protein LOC108105940 [Drosophila eugracilis]